MLTAAQFLLTKKLYINKVSYTCKIYEGSYAMGGRARVASSVDRLIFDTEFQKVLSNSLKASGRLAKMKGGTRFTKFGKQIGDAFVRAEKKTGGTPFFKDMKKLVTDFPGDLKTAWQGAKGFTGKAKALWNVTKSRGPLLGYGLLAGFEIPNIVKATVEDGAVSGAVETGKSTARLAGASLGAAIGTALVPGLGSIIGWLAGDYITGKIVGKSYTDKKLAQEQKMLELMEKSQKNQLAALSSQQLLDSLNTEATNPFTTPPAFNSQMTSEQLQQMYNALYGQQKLDLNG